MGESLCAGGAGGYLAAMPMTARQFGEWRERCGLSITDVEIALGVDRRTVTRYMAGDREIPEPTARLCRAIEAALKLRGGQKRIARRLLGLAGVQLPEKESKA